MNTRYLKKEFIICFTLLTELSMSDTIAGCTTCIVLLYPYLSVPSYSLTNAATCSTAVLKCVSPYWNAVESRFSAIRSRIRFSTDPDSAVIVYTKHTNAFVISCSTFMDSGTTEWHSPLQIWLFKCIHSV